MPRRASGTRKAKPEQGDLAPRHNPSDTRALAQSRRLGGARPTIYRPELAADICERVAAGETLSAICAEPGMPNANTFRRWVVQYQEVREAHNAARTMKAHSLFDEALDMAREIKQDPGTSQKVRAYDIVMNHLRWSAAKLYPQEYSDRSHMAVTVPIQINTTLDMGKAGQGPEDPSVYHLTGTIQEEVTEPVDDTATSEVKARAKGRAKGKGSGKKTAG